MAGDALSSSGAARGLLDHGTQAAPSYCLGLAADGAEPRQSLHHLDASSADVCHRPTVSPVLKPSSGPRVGDHSQIDFRFLKIASAYDFVLHSVLAMSATHLAWVTECQTTLQLACHHRGIAFRGLQEAIGLFSRQNSDAVLAASILLSMQVTDWYVIPPLKS